MSHSVFVHYIFNILLLLLLLIGFLYPIPFIYKDTKKNHVCNFNNISPSFNIQSYFINSLNQKHFPQYLPFPPVPFYRESHTTQFGLQEGSATQFSALVFQCKTDTKVLSRASQKADLVGVRKHRNQPGGGDTHL